MYVMFIETSPVGKKTPVQGHFTRHIYRAKDVNNVRFLSFHVSFCDTKFNV